MKTLATLIFLLLIAGSGFTQLGGGGTGSGLDYITEANTGDTTVLQVSGAGSNGYIGFDTTLTFMGHGVTGITTIGMTGNLYGGANMYVNYDTVGALNEADAYIYFWEGGVSNGASIRWNTTDNQFVLNKSVYAGGFVHATGAVISDDHLHANYSGDLDVGYLYFWDDSAKGAWFGYDTTAASNTGEFSLSNTLALKDLDLYTGGDAGGVYDTTDAPADGDILTWNTGGTIDWQTDAGATTGEVNTLLDTGTFNATSGFGLAGGKTDVALKVKGLLEGSNIAITESGDSALSVAVTISADLAMGGLDITGGDDLSLESTHGIIDNATAGVDRNNFYVATDSVGIGWVSTQGYEPVWLFDGLDLRGLPGSNYTADRQIIGNVAWLGETIDIIYLDTAAIRDSIEAFIGDSLSNIDSTNITNAGIDDEDINFANVTLGDFDYQTAWRVFYSDTDGDVTELALGADGTYLKSNGASSAPTFATPAGAGDLLAEGTVPMTADWAYGNFDLTTIQRMESDTVETTVVNVTGAGTGTVKMGTTGGGSLALTCADSLTGDYEYIIVDPVATAGQQWTNDGSDNLYWADPGAVAAQSVGRIQIDSTATDIVMAKVYKVTGAEEDSVYSTEYFVQVVAGDSAAAYDNFSEMSGNVTSAQILDDEIIKDDMDTTSGFVAATMHKVTSADADSAFMTKDYIDGVSGSATAYDDIADPDASGSIAMGAYTGTYTSATDGWGGLIISNTVADMTSADYLLTLSYKDDADVDADFIRCMDNDTDVKFSVTEEGNVTTTGTIAATGTITATGLLLTAAGLDAVGDVDMDYGSADVDDHTFVTDGTGTAEIVLPAGSIDGTEILDETVDTDDIADDAIEVDQMGDDDHGDFSYSSGVATLDADVVAAAEMADADHGDFTWSGGSATLDADVVEEAEIADNGIDSEHYNDGSIDLAHLAVNSVDSTKIVANSVSMSGDMKAFASADMAGILSDETGSGLAVFGTNPTFADSAHIVDDLSVGGEVWITGDVTLGDSIHVADDISIGGDVWASGDILGVDSCDITKYTDASIDPPDLAAISSSELAGIVSDETGSGLAVFGTNPTFADSAHIVDDLSVGGEVWITGDVTLGDSMHVTDDISVGGEVWVTGDATFGDSIHVVDDVSIGGDVWASGDILGVDSCDITKYTDASIDLPDLASGVYAKDIVTTAPVTGAADNVLVGADSDVTLALDFTAAWDFGAATSLEIPEDPNPTTDALGEIAWDGDDGGFEVYDTVLDASVFVPFRDSKEATIVAPDGVNDTIELMTVDSLLYPHGIEVERLWITLKADAAYSMVFIIYDNADPPALDDYIDTVTTGSGDAFMPSLTFENSTLTVGERIHLAIPATDVPWVKAGVVFHAIAGD